MKKLVIIPTYNESGNVTDIITTIRQEVKLPDLNILVVDSASTDGTPDEVRALQKDDHDIFLIEQSAKLGLGKAYLEGMHWALQQDFECICTMDADFSHHPRYLNSMFEKIENHDLVIGSRYIKGGALENWPKSRQFLSRFANWYATTLTGLPFKDLTSGFHCYRSNILRKILRYKIHTEGYAFLVEMKFLSILQGSRYFEIPIIFSDRTKGDSKISKRVIFESMLFVLSRSLQRWRVKRVLKKSHLAMRETASSMS